MAWTFAAKCSDLDGRDVLGVVCQGRRVALYRLEAGIFATSDVCPHQGAPLSRGCVVDGYIECPVHLALFDIRTGVADGAVTPTRLTTFATKVEHDAIYVDVPAVEETAR